MVRAHDVSCAWLTHSGGITSLVVCSGGVSRADVASVCDVLTSTAASIQSCAPELWTPTISQQFADFVKATRTSAR